MKWFGVDSDTPNDPRIKALLFHYGGRQSHLHARARMGGLFLVWCHIADHGCEPGRGIDASGQPLPLQEIADAALFDSVEQLEELLMFCATRKHIDPVAWETRREVFFPAMAKRADEYTKKLQRRGKSKESARVSGASPDSSTQRRTTAPESVVTSPESPVCTVGTVDLVQVHPDHPERSERDTPRAREATVMTGSLPRDHRTCFGPCGRICYPMPLATAHIRAIGGDEDQAFERLATFRREVLASIKPDQPIGDSPFDFWRAHFAATFPSAAPAMRRPVAVAAGSGRLGAANASAYDIGKGRHDDRD